MLRLPSPSLIISMLAFVVALGGAGYSAAGGNFILGVANSAGASRTLLITPRDGAAFQVNNTSTGAAAAGISVVTDPARPPFIVNSAARVANLNADKLDGVDASGFVQGGGIVDGQAIALAAGSADFLGPATGGLIRLRYQCPASLGSNGILTIQNASTGIANVFVDSGVANADYYQLGAGGFVTYPAAAGGDSFSIQAQGGPGVASIEVATVHRNASNDCHAQALLSVAG